MGILTDLVAPGGSVFGLIDTVVKRMWPDPAQQAQARLQLLDMQQKGELAQLDAELKTTLAQLQVDDDEAKSESIFKSGWRPFIGWTCGVACGWNWLGISVVSFACRLAGVTADIHPADLSQMWPVLLGMLGLGTLRTVEKMKGAN
jgi:hypothetical protein